MKTITLEQAVIETVTAFTNVDKTFSAHEVTNEIRKFVNKGEYEISGIPFGYVDAANTHSQQINHADVRDIVAQHAQSVNLVISYNSGYRAYSKPVVAAPVVAPSINAPKSIQDRVYDNIVLITNVDISTITNSSDITTDFGADSLDLVEFTMALEEEFAAETNNFVADENDIENLTVVDDIIKYVEKQIATAKAKPVANSLPVPQRFTVTVDDNTKAKITRYVRNKLTLKEPVTLHMIQKTIKAGIKLPEIESIVKAEGWALTPDSQNSARSLYRVS